MEDEDKSDKDLAPSKGQETLNKAEKELSNKKREETIEEKEFKYYLNSWRRGGINE